MGMIINFLKLIYAIVTTNIFRFVKLVLRKLTKLTELQRIVYGELRGCRRIKLVEDSLMQSRNPDIHKVLEELDVSVNNGRFDLRGSRKAVTSRCAANICIAKRVSTKHHAKFMIGINECLEVIYAFKNLIVKLEMLRTTQYSLENPEHEAMLFELWENFMAPEELSGRKSRQWQHLGFQGNDPATDFRGAGILALESLLHLSRNYPDVAKRLLENSSHPLFSYPFALLSIQITYMAVELCRQGFAKTHFYNRAGLILSLDERASPKDASMWGNELLILFYEFCSSLLVEFDSYWFATKPKDIMEYGRVKSEFDERIKRKLRCYDTCFLMEVRTI